MEIKIFLSSIIIYNAYIFTSQLVGEISPASWGVLRLFWITWCIHVYYIFICVHHNA